MKNLLSLSVMALLGASIVTSCFNEDSDKTPLAYGILKIDSIAMPDTASLGVSVEIKPYIQLKKECQTFQDIKYRVSGDKERTIFAIGAQQAGADCSNSETTTISQTFVFQPVSEGTYTFKFLKDQEKDEKGDYKDIYISKKLVIKKQLK